MNRRLNIYQFGWLFFLFSHNFAAVTLQFVSHNFLDYHDPTIGIHWNRFCFHFISNANYILCVCLQRIPINNRPLLMARQPYWIFLIRLDKWNSLRCETNICVAVKDSLFVIRYNFRKIFLFQFHRISFHLIIEYFLP